MNFFGIKSYSPVCRVGCFAPNFLRDSIMASQQEMAEILAMASELDMNVTEDKQGERVVDGN